MNKVYFLERNYADFLIKITIIIIVRVGYSVVFLLVKAKNRFS